jgi:phosphonoacetate hydrolase
MRHPRRTLVAMIDGFGADYFAASEMPALRALAARGHHKTVDACVPTVTNVNNAGIATGAWPREHGITANSYFDLATREEHYMDRGEMLLVPTLFERARRAGMATALLTAKVKTIRLLGRSADVALAAEAPSPEWVDRLGPPPDIYSAEINVWLLEAALAVLRDRPDVGLLYCHTTDYPMHMCDPAGELSQRHLAELDRMLGRVADAVPDLALYLTADHGMNAKQQCYDLQKHLAAKGCPIFFAMSAERDPYVRHHRTFGGAAYVWLEQPADRDRVVALLADTPGVEAVHDRAEAARRFHLHPERIGDLVVMGDRDTVFGPLAGPLEDLPAGFRTHGSGHELAVPLVVSGVAVDPEAWAATTHNLHLTRSLDLGDGPEPAR